MFNITFLFYHQSMSIGHQKKSLDQQALKMKETKSS
jgi:hypothetical protein